MNDTKFISPARPADSNKGLDQATLIVKGREHQDWESVWVQLRWTEGYPLFKFTAVERDTPAGMFYAIQFMPGDPCQVNLGGVDVIKGYIETRQVAYDAERHGIELSGVGITASVGRSSVDTKTGSFDGMAFQEVVEKCLTGYPCGIKIIGELDKTKFDKLQNQPGEPIFDFLERIARPRGIILGSDSFGNFLLIGEHKNPILNTQLIEGQNIRRAQFLFYKKNVFTEYKVVAQAAASDDNAFTKASQLEASWGGSGYLKSILITPAEQPVPSIQEVQDRARYEALWHEGPTVELNVTVQGWFRDGNEIWWPGDNVFVYSPMCPLRQVMKIQTVTFSQDSENGTETTLLLVQPWALKDKAEMNVTPSSPYTQEPQQIPEK